MLVDELLGCLNNSNMPKIFSVFPVTLVVSFILTVPVASAEGTILDCSQHEAKIIECIEHPEWRGEELEPCDKGQIAYRQCTNDRRMQAGGEPAAMKAIMKNEYALNEKRVKAYKKAKKVCQKKKDACRPEWERVIDKQIKGLPKENAKIKKEFL